VLYFNFTVPGDLEPLDLGYYWISYEVVSELDGRRMVWGEERFPHRVTASSRIVPTRNLKAGENAAAYIDLSNTGKVDVIAELNITSDLGTNESTVLTLDANTSTTFNYTIQVPDDITGKKHYVDINIGGKGMKPFSWKHPVWIAEPAIAYNTTLNNNNTFAAGEDIEVLFTLENTGGFNLKNLSLTARIPGIVENASTIDLGVGEVRDAGMTLRLPARVLQGHYYVYYTIQKDLIDTGINGTITKSGRIPIYVKGEAASIDISTDRAVYEPSENLTITVAANNTGFLGLQNATINVKAYRIGIDDNATKAALSNLTARLLAEQGSNGSWWDNDVQITAQALSALVKSGVSKDDAAVQDAVDWLVAQQASEGYWSSTDVSPPVKGGSPSGSVVSTSLALSALLDTGLPFSDTVIQDGVAWLITQQTAEGSWIEGGEPPVIIMDAYETGLAIEVMQRVQEYGSAQAGVDWLVANQYVNGSWDGGSLWSNHTATSSAISGLGRNGVRLGSETVERGIEYLASSDTQTLPDPYQETAWKLKAYITAGIAPESSDVKGLTDYLNGYSPDGLVHPIVPLALAEYLGAGSYLLYNNSYLVALAAKENRTDIFTTTIPLDVPPGSYRAAVEIHGTTELDRASSDFSIVVGEMVIEVDAPALVKEGAPVQINVSVEKLSGLDWADANLVLEMVETGETLLNDTFTISPGEEKGYSLSYTPVSTGEYTLAAYLYWNGLVRASAVMKFRVAEPMAEIDIAVDRAFYLEGENVSARVSVNNTDELDINGTLIINGNSSAVILEAGEGMVIDSVLKAQEGMIIHAELKDEKGSTVASKTMPVQVLREEISAAFALERSTYSPGETVTALLLLVNNGSVDSVVDARLEMGGEEVDSSFLIKAGDNLTWKSGLNASGPAGEQVIIYSAKTSLGKLLLSGNETIIVSTAKELISIDSVSVLNEPRSERNLSLEVNLSNMGSRNASGRLEVRILNNNNTAIASASSMFTIMPADNLVQAMNISLPYVTAGNYTLEASAFYGNAAPADKKYSVLPIKPGDIRSINASLDRTSYVPGDNATLFLTLENAGGAAALEEITLSVPGILEVVEQVYLDPGEIWQDNISFVVPYDLNADEYELEYLIGNYTGELNLKVFGANVSVDVLTDRDYYTPDENATITFDIENKGMTLDNSWLKVGLSGTENVVYFNLSAAEKKNITVVVPAPDTSQKLFWGVYQSSGRAIILGDHYLGVKPDGAVFLQTDKSIYVPGDVVTLYAEINSSTYLENATLDIGSNMFSTEETFSGEIISMQWNFTIPEDTRTDSYPVSYLLESSNISEYGSISFDVRGYSARFLESKVDRKTYAPAENGTLFLKLENNGIKDINGSIRIWVYDWSGSQVYSNSTGVLISVSEIEELTLDFETGETPGTHSVIYGIFLNNSVLASGTERFDVRGVVVTGLTTDKNIYSYGEQVKIRVEAYSHDRVESQVHLAITNQDGTQIFSDERNVNLRGFDSFEFSFDGSGVPGLYTVNASIGRSSRTAIFYKIGTTDGIDTTPPVTTDDAPAGWQNSDVTVTLSPYDALSGVANTYYCVDQTDTCTPTTTGTSVHVSAEGTSYVRYYSTDNAGNNEAVNSAAVQIDKTAPIIVITSPVESETYMSHSIDLDYSVTDALSGIGWVGYSLDGQPNVTTTGEITTFSTGETAVNVTLGQTGINTAYITVPKNATVYSASMNVSGYAGYSYYTQDEENASSYDGDWMSPDNAYDENWDTAAYTHMMSSGSIYEDYILQTSDINYVNVTVKASGTWSFYVYNFTGNNWDEKLSVGSQPISTYVIQLTELSDYINQSSFKTRFYAPSSSVEYYESRITIVGNTLYNPTSVSMDTGSDEVTDWPMAGELNSTNSPQTVDLNITAIQAYLDNCTTDLCDVPLEISSDSAGIVELDGLSIEYYSSTTLTSLHSGGHNVTLYASDAVGNLNFSMVYFTVMCMGMH